MCVNKDLLWETVCAKEGRGNKNRLSAGSGHGVSGLCLARVPTLGVPLPPALQQARLRVKYAKRASQTSPGLQATSQNLHDY